MIEELVLFSEKDDCLIFKMGKRTILTTVSKIKRGIEQYEIEKNWSAVIAVTTYDGYLGEVEAGSVVSDKIIEWCNKRGVL